MLFLSFTHDSALTTTWRSGGKTSWKYERDGKRLVMDQSMCEKSFPGLYTEVDRMVQKRRDDKITKDMLDVLERRNGYVRVMLHDQQV